MNEAHRGLEEEDNGKMISVWKTDSVMEEQIGSLSKERNPIDTDKYLTSILEVRCKYL